MNRSVFFVGLGRIAIALSVFALLCAWVSQFTGGDLFGLSQEHLFNDATILALLGIAFLLDGMIHKQENE